MTVAKPTCKKNPSPLPRTDGVLEVTVQVRTPLSQAHTFTQVLRTKEGYEDLKAQALLQENVEEEHPKHDITKKA